MIDRLKRLADNADGNTRLIVRKWGDGFHLILDGWDVATVEGNRCAYCMANVVAAENLIGISSKKIEKDH